jgi:hypothetical protein
MRQFPDKDIRGKWEFQRKSRNNKESSSSKQTQHYCNSDWFKIPKESKEFVTNNLDQRRKWFKSKFRTKKTLNTPVGIPLNTTLPGVQLISYFKRQKMLKERRKRKHI